MSRFRYRLAAPLRLAEIERSACRRQLAQAILRTASIRERLDALEEEKVALQQSVGASNAGIPGDELASVTKLYRSKQSVEHALREQLEDARQGEATARDSLVQATRKLRGLQEHERKARAAHEKERQRFEQKQIDEVAMQRFAARAPHTQTGNDSEAE